jgi:type IV pilus assembly protein PilW
MMPKQIKSNQAGLSLVELLIALALGLLIIAAVGSVFLVARQGFQTTDDRSRIFENGRLAMDLIGRNIRIAGAPLINVADPGAAFTFLSPPGFLPLNSGASIQGIEGGAGPDSIAISYDSIDAYNAALLSGADCLGQAVPVDANGFRKVVNTFAVAATEQLTCQGNGGANVAPIVTPVVDLQLTYVEVMNASPQPAQDPPTPILSVVNAAGVTNWANIRAVNMCVQVASFEPNTVDGATPGVGCNGAAFPADNRVHRAFRGQINVRNNTRGNIYDSASAP